jgi:RNA polymerase sigma factor (sigma-70 family)
MTVAMAGEKQNIIQAVKNYGRQLFGFIRSRVNTEEDAEDILQDVWYQLSSQTRSEDIVSLSGWLYRVARNRIADNYRKKKEDSLEDMAVENEDGEWQLPDILFSAELFRVELAEALGELPENQRNVFIWNELEELTLQEIADREKENIKTIISRKRYAVQHLRTRLEYLNNEFFNE